MKKRFFLSEFLFVITTWYNLRSINDFVVLKLMTKKSIMIKMSIKKKEIEQKMDDTTKMKLLEALIKAEEQILDKIIEIIHFILGELDGVYSQNEKLLPFNVNNRELLFKLTGKYMSECVNLSEKLKILQLGGSVLGI